MLVTEDLVKRFLGALTILDEKWMSFIKDTIKTTPAILLMQSNSFFCANCGRFARLDLAQFENTQNIY